MKGRDKVGIFYICTGKYVVFLPGFLESFQDHFLPSCELFFIIFTDRPDLVPDDPQVRVVFEEQREWPWPTLLRFRLMAGVPELTEDMDFLFFMNSNLQCVQNVSAEEFLPRREQGERLVAVRHPAFLNSGPAEMPFESDASSLAYVPSVDRRHYCLGGINGGDREAYLIMVAELSGRVDQDLSLDKIAVWHDESHFNRYIQGRSDVRILMPEYCYPEGWISEFETRILLREKNKHFDVDLLKGWALPDDWKSATRKRAGRVKAMIIVWLRNALGRVTR